MAVSNLIVGLVAASAILHGVVAGPNGYPTPSKPKTCSAKTITHTKTKTEICTKTKTVTKTGHTKTVTLPRVTATVTPSSWPDCYFDGSPSLTVAPIDDPGTPATKTASCAPTTTSARGGRGGGSAGGRRRR